jgi:hypothetical protein
MGDDLHINKQTNIFLHDKQFHLQLKSEQKEMIQNVLERKDSMAVLPTASERACVTSPLFGQGKIIFFIMVICNFANHFSIHS